jgi:hypothetical protein
MFTHMFQFFLTVCTLGVVVAAILTHRADRRETVARANRAFTAAQAYIQHRSDLGYYDNSSVDDMKKDFDKKYIELIRK